MAQRFRFRLDPVLGLRERVEAERQREFAEKQRAVVEAEAVRLAFVQQRDGYQQALVRDHKSFDSDLLRSTYAHLAYLDRAIEDQAERVAACVAEADRAHARMVAAMKDRKVLATLKDRRRESYDATAALVEQRELDDANARSYGHANLQQGMSV